MCDPTRATIYQLVNLDDGTVFYVGSTWKDPLLRFREHVNVPPSVAMRDYLRSHRVGVEVLRSVPIGERKAAETAAIHAALSAGCPLLNVHLYGYRPLEQLRLFG